MRSSVDQALRCVMDEQVPKPVDFSLDCVLALRPGHAAPEPRRSLDLLAQQGTRLKLDFLVANLFAPESRAPKILPVSPGKADSPSSVVQSGFWVVKGACEIRVTLPGFIRCNTRGV